MKRLLASVLSIAATLLECMAVLLWLAHDVLTWTPPPSDPFGEWAGGDGDSVLASFENKESGRL